MYVRFAVGKAADQVTRNGHEDLSEVLEVSQLRVCACNLVRALKDLIPVVNHWLQMFGRIQLTSELILAFDQR
jgi:hypothetical protein